MGNNNEFVKEEFREGDLTAEGVSFVDRQRFNGAQAIGGAIFNATIDRSHPINFGIEDSELALFRNSRIFMEPDKNSYNNPIRYTNDPVLSGYISEEQLALLKGSVLFKVKHSVAENIVDDRQHKLQVILVRHAAALCQHAFLCRFYVINAPTDRFQQWYQGKEEKHHCLVLHLTQGIDY